MQKISLIQIEYYYQAGLKIRMQQKFKIYCSQVSGKQPKLISYDQLQLLKGYDQSENAFYQYVNSLQVDATAYGITKWVPRYYGIKVLNTIPIIQSNQKVKDQKTKEWLEHLKARYAVRNPENKFILLENISHNFIKPNVLDIKIGTRNCKTKQHKITQTVSQYMLKLNGCRLTITQPHISEKMNQPKTLFFSKYYCKQIIKRESILQFLALYFFNGKKLRTQVLNIFIRQLKQLVLDFSCVTCYKFYSTSICFFCDAFDDTKCKLKLIDFGRAEYSTWLKPDAQSITGLQNILRFLIQILENSQAIQLKLLNNIENYKKQNPKILLVPQNKIKQYQQISTTNQRFTQ